MIHSHWPGGFAGCLGPSRGLFPTLPASTYVLGLVKSYWPTTRLDALGKGAEADCTEEQFSQYLEETSVVDDQILESLSKPESP